MLQKFYLGRFCETRSKIYHELYHYKKKLYDEMKSKVYLSLKFINACPVMITFNFRITSVIYISFRKLLSVSTY